MHKLAQSVGRFIRKHDLLRAGERVGVAVSGGADSVALLRVVLELRSELGIVVSLLHLNHQLRGEEAQGDEQFVRRLAASQGLEIVSSGRDVRSYAAANRLSIETAARKLRYEFFGNFLKQGRLEKIATAHTVDDQAETVLLKLVRGAGTRGLSGIYPRLCVDPCATTRDRQVAIVRPLLGTRRADLIAYLGEIGQEWREDSSNRDLRYARNRMRHGILTRLAQQFNPQLRETLAQTAEIARSEEEFWTQELGRWLPQAWRAGEGCGALDGKKLEELTLAGQRRLVRAAGESLGMSLEFHHVEEVLGLGREGERAALPGGWRAVRHKGKILFEQESGGLVDYEYELPVPGRVAVREAAVIVEALEVRWEGADHRYDAQHLLELSIARRGLRVRNWRAGDRFWPAHTKEPRKIKELLSHRHIAGEEKRRWTVVVSGEEIVWMRGFGVRRDYQAAGTEGVLIREVPMESPDQEAQTPRERV